MKWNNLKENKCPQCDKDFMLNLTTYPLGNTQMLAHGCGFRIRESRYAQIVNSQITQDLEDKWNQEYE